MVTVDAGADQLALQIGVHRLIRVSGGAGAQLDALLRQSGLGAAADAAADQNVDAAIAQQGGQGAVAAAVGVDDLRGDHPAVLHLIDLERLRVAEVLEHFAVFIGDCDFHSACFSL